jgi:hypothetical protein
VVLLPVLVRLSGWVSTGSVRVRAGLLVDAVAGPGRAGCVPLAAAYRHLPAGERPPHPLVQVRDFARHKSLTTTETYVRKIDSPELTAAMAAAMALEHSWHTDSGPLGSDGE